MRTTDRVIALLAAAAMTAVLQYPAAAEEAAPSFTPSEEFQQFITSIVRDTLPAKYEKTKNWGNTKRAFDGWKVEQDGLKIETRRRWKDANDGAWQKYSVRLIDPDEKLQIRIENMQEQPGGKVSFDLSADARLAVFGRQSQWESGVQLYSLSVEATARVRLEAHVEVGMRLDAAKFPPDVYLQPVVTSADLEIPDFRLTKVSHLEGPLVRSLSHRVREVLEEKVADDRKQLLASLNRQIAKNQHKLKFSPQDLLHSFAQ